jgi:hypothetical protein
LREYRLRWYLTFSLKGVGPFAGNGSERRPIAGSKTRQA